MKLKDNCLDKLNKLYKTEIGRIVIALFVTIVFFAVLYIKSAIVFFINDDENIMYTLAGYYTGGNTADHSFVNYFLGVILRAAYEVFPGIPWYGIFHVVILFLSVTVIGKSILKISYKNNIPLFYPVCIFSSLCVICYVSPIILMQFTTTSTLAGTAALALFFAAQDDETSSKWKYIDIGLSIVFLLVCYMHRKNTGYIILCYYALTALYRCIRKIIFSQKPFIFWQRGKNCRKNIGVLCIGLVSIFIVAFGSQNIFRATQEWDEFYKYDEARFKMTDYPHDSIYDNPELYEELGWTESLYELAGTSFWFFMDDRIDVDSFEKISETGYNSSQLADISTIIGRAVQLVKTEYVALTHTICCVLLLIVALALSIKNRNVLDFLMACCIVGGAFCMSFYLCLRGRFILRAFQVIMIPAILLLGLLILKGWNEPIKKTKKKKLIQSISVVVLGLAVFAVGLNTYWKAGYEAAVRVEKTERTLSLEEYAINNPENMYIYDTSLTFRYSPFTAYKDKYPSNVMFWGGMGWNSPAFNEQIRINNLESSNSDAFFQENVYYVTYPGYVLGDGTTMMDMFVSYMQDTYGPVEFVLEDELENGVCIYKLAKSS